MKYLLSVFSAILLLTSCSDTNPPTVESDNTTEIVVSEADTESLPDEETSPDTEDPEDPEDPESEQSDTDGLDQKNVQLQVKDQKTFGQVTIEKIATSRDGWVSIHKSKPDGSIQQPEGIGEARVDSGDSENIVVDLWEAPAVGDKLWALLHIDAGERGLYEYPGKDAPVQKNGETMARSFVIQGEKKEAAADAE